MVAVATDPFRYIVLPQLCPRHTTSAILREPFVIEFIDYKNAKGVAEVEEALAVGIVGGADVVESKVFQQSQTFLDGTGIGSSAEGAERMMVGNTFEDDLATVEFHAERGRELELTDAEA